jgi:hypothetical protein
MEIEIRVALLHVPRYPTDYVIPSSHYERRVEHKNTEVILSSYILKRFVL